MCEFPSLFVNVDSSVNKIYMTIFSSMFDQFNNRKFGSDHLPGRLCLLRALTERGKQTHKFLVVNNTIVKVLEFTRDYTTSVSALKLKTNVKYNIVKKRNTEHTCPPDHRSAPRTSATTDHNRKTYINRYDRVIEI